MQKCFAQIFFNYSSAFVVFWQKNIGAKAASKILVKLTTGSNIIVDASATDENGAKVPFDINYNVTKNRLMSKNNRSMPKKRRKREIGVYQPPYPRHFESFPIDPADQRDVRSAFVSGRLNSDEITR